MEQKTSRFSLNYVCGNHDRQTDLSFMSFKCPKATILLKSYLLWRCKHTYFNTRTDIVPRIKEMQLFSPCNLTAPPPTTTTHWCGAFLVQGPITALLQCEQLSLHTRINWINLFNGPNYFFNYSHKSDLYPSFDKSCMGINLYQQLA